MNLIPLYAAGLCILLIGAMGFYLAMAKAIDSALKLVRLIRGMVA